MRLKHPKISILIFVVVLLVGIRLILTDIALNRLNGYLAGFSETYAAHVDNLSLSFLRGAYRFDRVKVFTKPDHKEFLTVDYVDVSLAWRDLLSLRFRTDILLHNPKLIWSDAVKKALISKKTKEESEKAGARLFPVEISRLDVRGAEILLQDAQGVPPELALRLSELEGRVSNASPSEKKPVSMVRLSGLLQDSARVQMRGEVDSSVVPVEWYVAMESRDLKLNSLNPFLLRQVPLSFKKGTADVYAELKGDKGNLKGYVKPFLHEVEITGNESDFKDIKHVGMELAAGLAKLIFRRGDDKTVSTKMQFSYVNGQFEWSLADLVGKALEHGFRQPLEPGIENEFHMRYKQVPK